jgi:hypothetical protein
MLVSFRETAPFIGQCEDANVADLPGQCGAEPDRRRRLMTDPNRSLVDVEPAPENAKHSAFRSAY